MAEKVSVHWVHVKSTKTLASGKRRRYPGKRRFKKYIRHEDGYFETKYVGLGTFLYYNKRLWLLPFVGLGLAFFTRGIWLSYATLALRVLARLFGLDWPS